MEMELSHFNYCGNGFRHMPYYLTGHFSGDPVCFTWCYSADRRCGTELMLFSALDKRAATEHIGYAAWYLLNFTTIQCAVNIPCSNRCCYHCRQRI